MPVTTLGKRWQWKTRKCNCGECRVCRHREDMRLRYHSQREAPKKKDFVPLKRYDWDRT